MTALPAPRPAPASRPAWYRATRIGLSLGPLILVHLALVAAPFVEFSWLSVLMVVVVTRVPGLGLAAACFAVDGWSGLVFGFCLSVVAVFQATFAVNSIGHLFGPRRFDTGEGSRNNLVLGYLAMGDGWHNNHHRAPASARHGFAWYELDMSFNFIRLLQRLGLVWGVKLPPAHLLTGEPRRKPATAAPAPVAGQPPG